jgi:hypothetical protein
VIQNAEQALALLERSGVVTVVRAGACPSLVAEIIGEDIRGSWWGHAKGGVVYGILEALHDHPDVLATRLVQGKNTLVHRALWPTLLRLVTDESWRARAMKALDATGRELVRRVERDGRVAGGALTPTARRSKDAVATSLLVRVDQAHTPSGRHEVVLESWSAWGRERNVDRARLSFEDALARLENACGRGALPFASAF